MSDVDQVNRWLDENLPTLLAEYEVPGASVAVLRGEEVATSATGVLSVDTGVEATDDAVFQIGSITKVFTATLVMQLVDEGLVDLDAPVRRYLPEFRLADPAAADQVTVRHLLTHTSGFEGDIFEETTKYDDAVERFVLDVLPGAAQVFPPGERFSYNNAGFVVLGRLVEVLRGQPYSAALRHHLTDPLGMDKLAIGADEAILRRAAVGHSKYEDDTTWHTSPVWTLPLSNTPAGATPCLPAGQLIRFAGMHLSEGLAADGTRLLSRDSVRAMRTPQVPIPRYTPLQNQLGLSWHLAGTQRGTLVKHDGSTIGQTATLVTVPDEHVAVAVLTNGGDADGLIRAVLGHALSELADAVPPPTTKLPAEPLPVDQPSRYTGKYFGRLIHFEVTAEDARLWMTTEHQLAASAGADAQVRRELLRVDDDIFAAVDTSGKVTQAVAFLDTDERGRARYLHNHRANPRVA